MDDINPDQLPELRAPLLRYTWLQHFLGAAVGWYIAFPLLGVWRFLMWMLAEHGLVPTLCVVPVAYLFYGIQLCLAIIITKWVLLQRMSPGTYRLGSFFHIRWWFVDRLVSYATPLFLDQLRGTPWINVFFFCMGANISLNSYINTADITGYDLVEVQEHCIVLRNAGLHAHSLDDGDLVLGPINVGRGSYIGPKSLVLPDTMVNEGSIIRPMTVVREVVIEGIVEGSPARPVQSDEPNHELERGYFGSFMLMFIQPIFMMVAPALSALATYPAVLLISALSKEINFFPIDGRGPEIKDLDASFISVSMLSLWGPFPFHAVFVLIVEELDVVVEVADFFISRAANVYGIFGVIWMIVIAYFVYSLCLMLATAIVKWVFLSTPFLPRAYTVNVSNPIEFFLFVRKWTQEKVMTWVWYRSVQVFLGSEVSSTWLRICGARIGFRTVLAKVEPVTEPEMLSVGRDCHFGDGCMAIGAMVLPGGDIYEDDIVMENGALVGMHGLILPGAQMGEECILGALSLADSGQTYTERSIYFGTPSSRLFLNMASKNDNQGDLDVNRLVSPQFYLYMAFYPFIIFGLTIGQLALVGFAIGAMIVEMRTSVGEFLPWVLLPVIFFCFGLGIVLMGIMNKWLILQRFNEFNTPVFSFLFYRRSVGMAMNWFIGDVFMPLFAGTPFFLLWLRMQGVDVYGWRSYIEATFFTEPDLVSLGENCVVERNTLPFCHVMESGWLTAKEVVLEEEVRVGAHCVLLPEVRLSEGVLLTSYSCAAKAETLPPFTRCSGCPVSLIESRLEEAGGETTQVSNEGPIEQ